MLASLTARDWFDFTILVAAEAVMYSAHASPDRLGSEKAASRAQGQDVFSGIVGLQRGRCGPLVRILLRYATKMWASIGLLLYGWTLQSKDELYWVREVFHAGCIISLVGYIGRLICFNTLGKFFTFNLAIQDDHKVIRTGPYAYVRHPSYTAVILTWAGRTMTGFYGNPGISSSWRPVALLLGTIEISLWMWMLYKRVGQEEAMLKRELGKEYIQYMTDVPYRFIPGVV